MGTYACRHARLGAAIAVLVVVDASACALGGACAPPLSPTPVATSAPPAASLVATTLAAADAAVDAAVAFPCRDERRPGDPSRTVAEHEAACNAGTMSACQSLAYACARGDGIAKDDRRAARLYERVCDAASAPDSGSFDTRACVPFADYLLEGRWVNKDEARAARYYEAACNAGAFEVCVAFAELLAAGRGVAKNPVLAASLMELACSNAFGAGCDEGAAMFRSGSGVPRDLARAKRLEEEAVGWAATGCEMHAMIASCERVARHYARGIAPADAKLAMNRIEMACARGAPAACRLAARMYRAPAQAAKALARARDLADPARTKAMLERECDAGVLSDCYLLGEAYLLGNATWGVPKDVVRARALVIRSCPPGGDSLSAECRLAGSFEGAADEPVASSPCDGGVARDAR